MKTLVELLLARHPELEVDATVDSVIGAVQEWLGQSEVRYMLRLPETIVREAGRGLDA